MYTQTPYLVHSIQLSFPPTGRYGERENSNRKYFRVRPRTTVIISSTYCDSVGPLEPLKGVEETHIRKFHERNDLPIEEEIFVRGVLAFRHQKQLLGVFEDTSANVDIDMEIGDHQYTKQETEVIRKAWTRNRLETFRNLARLHRLLIVACIFAAMTQ